MPQRVASSAFSSSTAQRSGRSSPSWSGVAPFSSIEPRLSPIVRISTTSSSLRIGPAGTAASSSRLRSIGFASGPGSWISVGATHSTASCARFQTHASWSGVSPWRSAIGLIALEPLAAGLDPPLGPEAAVVV